jgi:ArsR family transcriptional regulator
MERSRTTAKKRAPTAGQDIFDLIGRTENIEQASDAMQAMAHPLRLKILCLVGSNELNVQEIVDAVGTSQSNISQHLAILRDRGILLSRKDANKVFYRVEDPRILKMISLTRDIFCST